MRGFDLVAIGLFAWVGIIVGVSHMLFSIGIMVTGIAGIGGLLLVLFCEKPTPGIDYDDTV